MAHGDVEIEIKLKLDEKQFLELKERVRKIAEYKKESSQKDEYFTPAHKDFLNFEYPYEWLRIGERSGKTILNYKHFYPENKTPFTHCDEFETEIHNPERLRKIFSALGARSLMVVDKQRETFIYKDEFEIALDTVKELGHFTEIEVMKDFGSIETAREMLHAFTRSLGLKPEESVERGYPYLLMEKKGLIKWKRKA
jgi:predicted adenylyl cyclase CyaB